jgi:hypothetical protein
VSDAAHPCIGTVPTCARSRACPPALACLSLCVAAQRAVAHVLIGIVCVWADHCASRRDRYRIFPLRLVLHIVLIATTTFICVMYNSTHGISSRAIGTHFDYSFVNQSWAQYAGANRCCVC